MPLSVAAAEEASKLCVTVMIIQPPKLQLTSKMDLLLSSARKQKSVYILG